MPIVFSKHAQDQLKQRGRITKNMVLETIKQPDRVKSSYRQRELYQKYFGEDLLEVVATQEDNKIIVITEYFLKEES